MIVKRMPRQQSCWLTLAATSLLKGCGNPKTTGTVAELIAPNQTRMVVIVQLWKL